jgi:hypothetical protein
VFLGPFADSVLPLIEEPEQSGRFDVRLGTNA